jgi:hypothetical protein
MKKRAIKKHKRAPLSPAMVVCTVCGGEVWGRKNWILLPRSGAPRHKDTWRCVLEMKQKHERLAADLHELTLALSRDDLREFIRKTLRLAWQKEQENECMEKQTGVKAL